MNALTASDVRMFVAAMNDAIDALQASHRNAQAGRLIHWRNHLLELSAQPVGVVAELMAAE